MSRAVRWLGAGLAAAALCAPRRAEPQSLPNTQTSRTVRRGALLVAGGNITAAGIDALDRLGELLKNTYGFTVTRLNGLLATREAIVLRMQTLAFGSDARDQVFVVMSLPTVFVSNSSFIVPADGTAAQTWTLIRIDEVLAPFAKSRSPFNFAILPACRSRNFGQMAQSAKGPDSAVLNPPLSVTLLTFCPPSGDAGPLLAQELESVLSRGRFGNEPHSVTIAEVAERLNTDLPSFSVELRGGLTLGDRLFTFDPVRDRLRADLVALEAATPAAINRLVQTALAAPPDQRASDIARAADALVGVADNSRQTKEARSRAIQALGELHAASVLSALGRLIAQSDTEASVRKEIVDTVARIGGPQAAPIVRARLRDPAQTVRESAVRALAGLRDVSSIGTLASMIRSDRAVEVRVACVQAIALLQPKDEGRAALVAALRDSEPAVRREAASALGGIGAPVAQQLLAAIEAERDPNVLQAMIYAVARVPPATSQIPIENALVKAAGSDAVPVREAAVWSLGAFSSDTARSLVGRALGDPSERVQAAAIQSAGRQRNRDAVPALISLLDVKTADLRTPIVDTLGRIGDRSAIPALMIHLKDDDEFVRTTAARSLALLRAANELEQALHDASPAVRLHAVEALTSGGAVPVPALVEALGDPDYDVRVAAIRALSGITDRDDIDAIIDALDDAEPRRQQAALVVIGNIASRPLPPNLRSAEPVVDTLLRRPPNSAIRAEAVRTAGKLGGAQWLDPMVAAAAADDASVRRAAAEALGRYADRRAIDTLQKLAQDPVVDVQQAAADSLRRLTVK